MKAASEIDFLVKVCGVTQEEDARVAIEAGANAIGFNFYPKSPRYVSFGRAQEIAQAVRGDYLRVGVFVNPSVAEIAEAATCVPLDVIQLHGNACPIVPAHLRVWRSISPAARMSAKSDAVEAYLFDTPSADFGGSGRTFDWSAAANFPYRAILAGGLDAENVAEAIATAKPWGVDACSRLESKPGRKNGERLKKFVQAAFAQARELSAAKITL